MLSLAEVEESIKAEIDIDLEGKGFLSIRGTARLCDVDYGGLAETFRSSCGDKPSKLAKKLIAAKFKPWSFSESGVPDLALIHILKYYAFEAGERVKPLAKQMCEVLIGVGARKWMQQIKGWEKQKSSNDSVALALPQNIELADKILSIGERLERLTRERLNPYLAQQIKDLVGNLITETNKKILTPSSEQWHGVVAVAERMGYSVSIKGTHNRGFLGAWIRCFYDYLGDKQDVRLCNETQQEIYVYACHDTDILAGLQKAIVEFFQDPEPSLALKAAGWFKRSRKPKLEVVISNG
ncbi:MAG: hypothetical protein PUP93_29025 [Rhizonema sp. NSF051]|nr:hypothetical protein [Rhizonema sp. NSF051]